MSFEHDLREYCIHVPASEPHHIRVSENNACLIDWMYFVKEPMFLLCLMYVVLILPMNILYFILKKRLKKT
jgi:hypothetical protein